jgi:site-specific recombinase XerD
MDYAKLINYFKQHNYSEASKGIYTRALYALFNYYIKNDYIRKNPITAIRKNNKPKPIDRKELEIIKDHIKKSDPEFYRVVQFALLTGFRRSTITEPMTIDLKRGIIHAKNIKVGRDFQFPIYSELEHHLREFGIEEYFVGKITKLTRDSISKKFHKAVGKLQTDGKIENKYNFHCLRHTAATGWGRRGLDIKSVKTLLDHTDIKTSEHYVESDYGYIKSKLN